MHESWVFIFYGKYVPFPVSSDISFVRTVLLLGITSGPALADGDSTGLLPEKDVESPYTNGLQKIDDGSVVSNEHTSKWRVFTDQGREFFIKASVLLL